MTKRLIAILVLCLEMSLAFSQLDVYNGDNYKIDSTEYTIDTIQDPIFVINGEIGDTITASIIARSTDTGTYNFDWRIYNSVTDTFDFLLTETNKTSSIYTVDTSQGLQVRVYDGASYDTTFTCWVFFNYLEITKFYKYNDGCGEPLNIRTEVTHEPDEFRYYEQGTGNSILIDYEYFISWEYEDLEDPGKYGEEMGYKAPDKENYYEYNPPPIDVEYTAILTDSFNNKVTSSFIYESIHSFARFDRKIWDSRALWKLEDPNQDGDPEDKYIYTDENPSNGREDDLNSAPADVIFWNFSKNSENYEWIFIAETEDSSLAEYYVDVPIRINVTDTLPKEFTYSLCGNYDAMLITTSEAGCTDTFPAYGQDAEALDVDIYIDYSEFNGNGNAGTLKDNGTTSSNNTTNDGTSSTGVKPDIPNVIIRSANGGPYSTFHIRNISLCWIYIKIYDRWGRCVFKDEHSGNIDKWGGWKGVDNRGKELPAGTYYYVMEAQGCEPTPVIYKDEKGRVNGQKTIKRFSGVIHIFDDIN